MDPRADRTVVVTEETAAGARVGAAQQGRWAFFGEGCEVGGSDGCSGAQK